MGLTSSCVYGFLKWVLSGYFTHLEIPGLGIFPLKGRVRAVGLMLLKKDEASLECWS